MSKDSIVNASEEGSKVGPDNFSYFNSEALRLLSQDESVLPFDYEDNGTSNVAGTLFDNGAAANLSDFRKEKLNSLLKLALGSFTPEVEEMLDPVVTICRLRALLKRKQAGSDDGASQVHQKKLKASTCTNSNSSGEEEDDLQVFLAGDPTLVNETMKKHSDELYASLEHMEKHLEELINAVVSKSRPMIPAEKHQLRNLIRELPPQNLERVAQIVKHGKPDEAQPCDDFFVDLVKEDDAKLWRLYYYVKAVEKARKHAS